ncbi:MAG: cytochrome P450 [Albidovulum sp.]|nr:cytochrome P450 [Albidovulum sp.]
MEHKTIFDITSRGFHENPGETYRAMWKTGDIVRVRLPFIGQAWLAVRSDLCREILKDSELYTRQPERAGKKDSSQIPFWMPGVFRNMVHNMLMFDEPEHRRLRRLVEGALARRNVSGLRAGMEDTADALLGKLGGNSTVDIIEAYTRELPMSVICEFLGIGREEMRRVKSMAMGLTKLSGAYSILSAMPSLYRLRSFLWEKFEQVRQSPENGLISHLVEIEEEGDRLSREELTSMVFMLFTAGHETTTHLLTGSILALLDHPEQKRALLGDWSQLPVAVEEFLRFVSPVQLTKPRFVTADTEIGSTRLKRGDAIMVHIGAANWDPRVRENPFEMDITRSPNYHLSFATGIHSCLGQQLARIEAQVGLKALFTRFPNLELHGDRAKLEWTKRLGMHSLARLQLRLNDREL